MTRYDVEHFAALVPEIAAALPGTWTCKATDADGKPAHYAELTREDGLSICIYLDTYRQRLSCSPRLPRSATGSYQPIESFLSYEERKAGRGKIEAKCALGRPAAAIARDFARRVVEPYAELYPRVMARAQEQRDDHAAFVATYLRLAQRYGDNRLSPSRLASEKNGTVYPSGKSLAYSIDVSEGGYAQVKLRSVSCEKLDQLLDVLDQLGCEAS